MDLFATNNYKEFLTARLAHNKGKRGYQKRLAQAAGCQSSFIVKVLKNRSVHMTPDQAAGIAAFWGMGEMEMAYFVGLVNLARASSLPLRRMIMSQLDHYRQSHLRLATRFGGEAGLASGSQSDYYASWHWAAIHMALTMPGMQKAVAIAQRLLIPLAQVEACLRGMASMGLVTQEGEEWQTLQTNVHLPGSSPGVGSRHGIWRQLTLMRLQDMSEDSLHYSAIQTLSRKDYRLLRAMQIEFIEKSRQVIAPSAPEELVVFTCDLYQLSS